MTAAVFELNVSLPPDSRFAETLRALASHAVRYAGCGDDAAETYGEAVERVALDCFAGSAGGHAVPVIVRRRRGPVEILIACERRFEGAAEDPRITVEWTRDAGAAMCRVAFDVS